MSGARNAGLTDQRKILANNKKIRHDYDVLGTYEAGIQLVGAEVKSLREAKVQLKDSYCRVERGEMLLMGMHISPYTYAIGFGSFLPERTRKLLMHRREIDRLAHELAVEHLALIPMSFYFKDGKVKVEIAVARGRKKADKRQALAERDVKMEMAKAMGRQAKGRVS